VHETVDVNVPVGFPNKEKIVLEGKGNEHPDYLAGDLVVIITVKEDSVFKRVNNDLYITKNISLLESLSGFSFNIKLLNEQQITVKTQKDQIINHLQEMKVPNLGMPLYKDMYSNGDLFIVFHVQLPSKLTPD